MKPLVQKLRLRFAGLTIVTLAALHATPADAHRAWLLPSQTVFSGDDPWLTVDAAISNDLFYFEHRAMQLNDVVALQPDGGKAAIENPATGQFRSTFDVHLTQPGTYKIVAGGQGLNASWKTADGQTKRWRGTKESFATEVPKDAQELKVSESFRRLEVFATRGKPTTTVLKPTNVGLELAPVTHPNDLFAGEPATFKLLLDGKPAAGVEVEIIPGGIRYRDKLNEIKLKTGDDGSFKVTWPNPGMYWMEAQVRDNKASVPNAQRSATYIATLEVLKP